MSLISENVIPGDHGTIFGTNAKEHEDVLKVRDAIQGVEGVKDAMVNEGVFPLELTVHTNKLVKIKDIEDAVLETGFHAIPKSIFPL